jgi:ADP-ribose pyrophosphatase YjhB (NUDIX family)
VARLSNATATSAGGIVVRYQGTIPQFVVGRRRRERDGQTWTLPKGTPILGESLEETALREVCEETGLTVRILSPLDAIKYTFIQRGTRIHKTVHYFIMEATGGDLEGHDREFEEVLLATPVHHSWPAHQGPRPEVDSDGPGSRRAARHTPGRSA